MNTTKLKVSVATLALFALLAAVVWQQWRARRLMAEVDALREQIGQAATLREEKEQLAEQLRLASERSKADSSELVRLRGQSVRMRQIEQENARLKTERGGSTKPPTAPTPAVPDDQTPEWGLAQVRMRFSKVLGLCIRMFANRNQGQMPTNVLAAISSQTQERFDELLADQLPPEVADHEIRIDQFELVFQGNLNATGRQPGSTIIARATEPVQLSNGRWARPCVFDDASGAVLVADTLEELATKEKKLMQAQTPP
jgi:hypothetical protein